MSDPQDIHQLAAAYSLDALEPDERAAFEAHYPTCESCTAEVDEFAQVASALAESVATDPPASLKQSVMRQVATTRQEPPVVQPRSVSPSTTARRPATTWLLAAAAALVVIAGLVVGVVTVGNDDQTVDQVVAAIDAVPVSLEALSDEHQGVLQVVWSDDLGRVAVIGTDLVDPAAGTTYALWAIRGDTVAPAALFSTTDGAVSQVLEVDDEQIDGWGITIEPAGGSDQPTTPVIYVGTL